MAVLSVFALLVYTFGAFAYGAIVLLWMREWGRVRWAASRLGPEPKVDVVSGLLFSVSLLWFVVNALIVLLALGPFENVWRLQFVALWLAFVFPPLIVHVSLGEARRRGVVSLHPGWIGAVRAMYVLSILLALAFTLGFLGVGGFPRRSVSVASSAGLGLFFTTAAILSILVTRIRTAIGPRERQTRLWWTALFLLMIPMFGLLVLLSARPAAAGPVRAIAELATKSLPLVFMFVGTYLENRFEFFDLFIKRGLALVVTTLVLALGLSALQPFLHHYGGTPVAPWVQAVVLLPIVVGLPWVHARISAMLDRRWLGRRFTTVEAVTRFHGRLRSATTEAQLVASARAGLSEIFSAPVLVRTQAHAAAPAAEFDTVQQVPARLGDEVVGWFILGRRASEAPYFSEDIVLLRLLADVFASVLHNLHLLVRQQDQDRRAQELSLHASQSELKALRAQINPHFLFNALNAIAGLIPSEPAVADRTIEKLAEVFRYALRGADSEWARLEDEIDFARAYLDVERARFGARLQTEVRLADDVRAARVPTMMVQTLVENAVKHGAAAVRDRAVVAIDARAEDGRVRIVVSDNGPGFDSERRLEGARRGGYGLANIRQRLEGYFGPDAALTVQRDAACGLTVASIVLPLLNEPPQPKMAAMGGDEP